MRRISGRVQDIRPQKILPELHDHGPRMGADAFALPEMRQVGAEQDQVSWVRTAPGCHRQTAARALRE